MSDYNQTCKSRHGLLSRISLISSLDGYSSAYPYSQYDQNQTAPRYNSTPHHDLPVENLTRALHHTNLDSHDSRSDAAYSHPPSSSLVYPSSHSQSTNGPALQAIPAALPKVDYAAPVFQTFQERKRAKEAALRAQNGASLPNPSYSSPPPKQTYTPPSATLAMMGSRQGGPPPAPPSRSSARPLSNSPSRHRSPLPTLPPPAVPPTATPATTLERSDTVSSIKSLDRLDFSASGKRPLPRTPIGVNSSKSLDRGLPTRSLDTRRSRQQPSVVVEEDEDASRPGSVVESSEQIEPPSISIPSIGVSDDKAPAKFTPLPTFNLPDGDSDDDQPGPSRSPQVAFTGLPTIQVSTEPSAATRITPSGAIVCAGCEQPIIGRIVNAMEQRFHPQCFRCNECGELLEHVSSYEWQGKAYCHLDYHDVSGLEVGIDDRNSPTIATTARRQSSTTALSPWTILFWARDIITSCTFSVRNAATLFSTPRNPLRPGRHWPTKKARRVRLSFKRAIHIAKSVICVFTSQDAVDASSRFQMLPSLRWTRRGTRSVLSARWVLRWWS